MADHRCRILQEPSRRVHQRTEIQREIRLHPEGYHPERHRLVEEGPRQH